MFTIHTHRSLVLTKSGVRWIANASDAAPDGLIKWGDFARLKQIWHEASWLSYWSKNAEFQDLLKKIVDQNQRNSEELNNMIDNELVVVMWEWDKKAEETLRAFKKTVEQTISEARNRNTSAKAVIVANTWDSAKQEAITTTEQLNNRKARTEKKFEDISYTVEKDGDEIKLGSMIALLSDFDGMAWVEATNSSIFRQALFGGGKQKEVIGERQVYELLSRLDKWALNTLYTRLTWDNSGLPWKSQVYRDGASRNDLDFDAQRKLTRFHRELADQTNMMADLTEAFLGKGVRTGLASVIAGNTEALKTAISDTKKQEEFVRMIEKSNVIKNDPGYLVKIVSAFIRIGVQVPLSLLSKGTVGAYIESSKITPRWVEWSLTAETPIGESGSVGISLDAVGIRLNGKWNNPSERIAGRTGVIHSLVAGDKVTASDVQAGVKLLTDKVTSELPKWDDEKTKILRGQVEDISKSYIARVKEVFETNWLDKKKKEEIITNMTLTYLSRAEAMKGFQLEGVFAAFNLAGWMLGLSGWKVDTSASFTGVNPDAARVEAKVWEKTLDQNKLDDLLIRAWVTKSTAGNYILPAHDDKPTSEVIVPNGKYLVWEIVEHVGEESVSVEATPRLLDKKIGQTSWAVSASTDTIVGSTYKIVRENTTISTLNNFPDSSAVSKLVHNLRQTKGKEMVNLNTSIMNEDYGGAASQFTAILDNLRKNPTAQALLKALPRDNSTAQAQYFDRVLELSSWGKESMTIAKQIISGKPQDVSGYYNKFKLNKAFGSQYGLSPEQVQRQIAKYGPLSQDQVSTLGKELPGGFSALVAFAQINGQWGKVNMLDRVNNADAGIIWWLKDADPVLENIIKSKFAEKITEDDLKKYKNLPNYHNLSWEEIIDLVVFGRLPWALANEGYTIGKEPKVKSYLSFVKDAPCFNLGFALTDVEIKAPDTQRTRQQEVVTPAEYSNPESRAGTGTTVGRNQANHLEVGVGIGGQWMKNVDWKYETQINVRDVKVNNGVATIITSNHIYNVPLSQLSREQFIAIVRWTWNITWIDTITRQEVIIPVIHQVWATLWVAAVLEAWNTYKPNEIINVTEVTNP